MSLMGEPPKEMIILCLKSFSGSLLFARVTIFHVHCTMFDTMSIGWLITRVKGSQFRFSKLRRTSDAEDCFVLANRAGPDEMLHLQHFIWVFAVC